MSQSCLIVASVVGYIFQSAIQCQASKSDDRQLNTPDNGVVADGGAARRRLRIRESGVIVLFALASLAAFREFITLTPTRRGDHVALAVAFFVVLPAPV